MDIKKAVAAISTILIILLSFRFAAAQITIPTPTGEFDLSTTFGMAVAAFIIGFGMMGIFIAWLYRQKKLRPEVVFPFEPKTLSGICGIGGVLVVLLPLGIIPEGFFTAFVLIIGAIFFVLVMGIVFTVGKVRGEEKAPAAERAFGMLETAPSPIARTEAAVEEKEISAEKVEEETLVKLAKFLHEHPKTRETLQTILTEHEDEIRKKLGRGIPDIVEEVHQLYEGSKHAIKTQEATAFFEAADLMLLKGKELIETQKDEKEETAQLKRELSFTRRTINRIKEAIEAGEITLEKEKTEEYHFLEILAIYVRQAIVESEREINQLEATPRKGDPDYETSLKTHKELRKELAKFEDILKRLIDEIVYEAHLLSEDTALVSKMKRVNRQVYGKEYKQQMKQEIRAESRFKIE